MSMSFLSTPATYSPAHNDLMYVIDSSNKAQPNYKYILDVYVSAVKVATLKCVPNPIFSNYGVFNIAKVIQNYLDSKYFIAPGTSTPVTLAAHTVAYQVKISESYDPSTINVNVATDSTRNGYNAALSFLDFAATNYQNLLNQFQTARPSPYISIDTLENFFLCIFRDPSSPADSYVISPYSDYNLGGSALTTQTKAISNDVFINIGTAVLGLPGGTLSYKVELKRSTTVLQTLKFNLDVCTRYTTVPLHFLNKRGGFETVYFRLVSKESLSIERKTMKEVGTQLNGSNVIVYNDTNNVFFETQRPWAANYTRTLKATCEYLSDSEYIWLAELLTSNCVYTEQVVNGTNYFIPVTIKETSYDIRKRIVDQLSAVQITLEYGQLNNTQYR